MLDSKERRTLLIADDSLTDRNFLINIFSEEFNIIQAENSIQVLDILRSISEISAVILDIEMAEPDGFAILETMQQNELLRNIPVIATAVLNDTEKQVKLLDNGAADILIKPFNSQIVLHRVRNIITRKEAVEQTMQNTMLKQLTHQSEIDEKTGIFNKYTFCRKTRELLNNNPDKKYVIFRWDIDRFKVFNDVFGISAGNEFLAKIGAVYRKEKINSITYGHWEADHFVTCIEYQKFIELDLESMFSKVDIELHPDFEYVPRMGVYIVNDRSLDVELMCDRALMALRSIKDNYDKKIAFYDESMRVSLIKELEIIGEMKTALSQGQFIVYLQPQYNYAQKKLHGAEALIRWQHPQKGMILPGNFVPIFERNGFIRKVDEYVWEQVCIQLRKWIDSGISVVPISVNLSRRNIYNSRLCSLLIDLVRKYDLDPSLLRLEITESSYMENPERIIKTVEKLRSAGFAVEMDDFGSGYSSLNMLKDITVDMLKLDMKFLGSSMDNARSGSILTSVIRMAHWIKLPVIAEGVETQEQAEYLKSVGCYYMQGYYFAQPMPVSEFENILRGTEPETAAVGRFSNDIVGSENFLSASTQAALLFNSFVGGAAIIEYDETRKNVEALRLNDKYFDVLGTTREKYAGKQINLLGRFDEKNQNILLSIIQKAIQTGSEIDSEICSKPFDEGGEPIWLQFRMRFLAKNENRYILYLAIENITGRVALMNRNKMLSEQLSSIMDSVPGGIFDFEMTDRLKIAYFNDIVASMTGYDRETFSRLYSETPLDAVHPDDIPELQRKIAESLKYDEQLHEVVYRHKCADDTWIWVRLTGRVIHRKNNTVFASGILMNIDDQIKNEQIAAKQAEELEYQRISLQTLYDTIPCGIMQFAVTKEKNNMTALLDFNNTAWKLFGYSNREHYLESVRGVSKLKDIYLEDLPIVHAAIDSVCGSQSEEIADYDHRIVRVDGSIRWVHAVIQKIRYSVADEVLQVVLYDITERKQENLRHISNALFSIYDEVYEVDMERNTCILRAANSHSKTQIGSIIPFDKYIKKTCSKIVHSADLKTAENFFDIKTQGKTTEPKTIEYCYYTAEGALHWTAATQLHIQGSSYLICTRDITEQKNAQNLAKENYVLQSFIKERQKEDERNRIFIETTGMIVFDYDPDRDMMKVQRKTADGSVTENTTEQYLDEMLVNPHISVEDRERIRDMFFETIQTPSRITMEFRSDEFGDGFKLCRMQMVSIADKNGKVYRIIGQISEVQDELQSRLYTKLYEITGQHYNNVSFHNSIVDDVLRILESAADSHSAVQTVLAVVGKQFNVSRVFIIEENEDGIHCSNTFEWCSDGITSEIEHLQNYEYPDGVRGKYIEMFDANGILACSDISVLPSWMYSELEQQGVKAVIQCAIMDNGIFRGYVGFDECTGPRKWTEIQIHTLQIISHIISIFLFANRNKKPFESSEDMIKAIQSNSAYMYIIDPDTCEILYSNDMIQPVIGDPLPGEPCYKVFMNRNSMCDTCPLKKLHETGIPVPTRIFSSGRHFIMQASPFLWKGRKAILISGTDASMFEQNAADILQSEYEKNLKQYARTLFGLYDEIFEFDFTGNSFTVLFSKYSRITPGEKKQELTESIKIWSERIISEADKKAVKEFMNIRNIRKLFREGNVPSVTYTISAQDGSERYCSSMLLQMDANRYLCCNKDITEQKNAEQLEKELLALQTVTEAQECYRIIVEQTGTAVVEMNFETGKISCSESYYKYETSRYSQEDMFNNSGDRNLVHPDDQNMLEAFFNTKNKDHNETILRIKMTDGSFRWTRMAGTYIRDQNGKILRSIGTFTDMDEEMRAKKELQSISKRLQQIITNIPTGVAIYEVADNVYPVFISDKACEIFGFTRKEYDLVIANGEPIHYMPPESELAPYINGKIKNGKPLIIPKIRVMKKDGSWIWLRVYYSMERNSDGKKFCYTVLADITGEIEKEQRSIWQAERYRLLSESTGVITFDYAPQTDTMCVFVTAAGKGPSEEKHTDYMKKFALYERIAQGSKNGFIATLRTASEKACSGTYDFQADYYNGFRWYQAKYVSVADEAGHVYRVVGRVDDINDIILAKSELRTNLEIDEVTGIRSKDSARAVIVSALKERHPAVTDAMLFIDVDNFKQINDTIGHFEADKILRQIAGTLQETFRNQDIVARFGGDEFIVYMQSAGSIKNVEEKAKHINKVLNKITFGKNVAVHCSIGITEIAGETRDFETVFKHADNALYASKHKGKSTYTVFDERTQDSCGLYGT